jgi:hypothetical protein
LNKYNPCLLILAFQSALANELRTAMLPLPDSDSDFKYCFEYCCCNTDKVLRVCESTGNKINVVAVD